MKHEIKGFIRDERRIYIYLFFCSTFQPLFSAVFVLLFHHLLQVIWLCGSSQKDIKLLPRFYLFRYFRKERRANIRAYAYIITIIIIIMLCGTSHYIRYIHNNASCTPRWQDSVRALHLTLHIYFIIMIVIILLYACAAA